jgi:myo-inositol-1(or 4)-monophosphatase
MNQTEERLLKGSAELNKMFAAVQRTGSFLRRDFGEVEHLQRSLRGSRDFVAKAAKRIEESVLQDLMLVRPNAGVLTPNISSEGDGRDEFVLALSGAENFVRSNPRFAISLALRSNDETKIAIIYSPIDEGLFYAEEDGAYMFSAYHSIRLNVSEKKDNDADLMIGVDSIATAGSVRKGSVRITGCPALDLAWVAAGKFDGYVTLPIDYAEMSAGEMILLKSGGLMVESEGFIAASNGQEIIKT